MYLPALETVAGVDGEAVVVDVVSVPHLEKVTGVEVAPLVELASVPAFGEPYLCR